MIRGTLIVTLLLLAGPAGAAEPRPNIVFLLADDLGHGDLGCQGCPDIKTSHLDRLAQQGVRFTQFYSNGQECTPTRAALMTGRYQHRVGGLECALGVGNVGRYDDAIRLRATHDLGLPESETSLARMLKEKGYDTAVVGKWHLGYEAKFLPNQHGFDHAFGPLGGSVDYFHHTEPDGTPMLYLNGKPVRRQGYMTDLIAEEAVAFLKARRDRPFYLYVPFTAPHNPFQGPNDQRDKPLTGEDQKGGSREKYREMVEHLDTKIGTILQALAETKLASNTLVIFTSDNGGPKHARNAPFSGVKGTLLEGGIRVPCLARWPGVLPAGATSDQVGITMDLTASLARAAGATPARHRPFDGIDLLAVAAGQAEPRPRTLFWRARRGENTWKAVRDGTTKFVLQQAGDKAQEHLFDLARDPAEKNNLLAQRPDEVARLKGLLAGWEKEVRAPRP